MNILYIIIMRMIHGLKSISDSSKYSRQGIVPDFLSTQKKLLETNILIIGIGGLGCPVSLYLSKMGGKITLLDFDKIEIHNLPRQILFNETQLNEYKSYIASKMLSTKDTTIKYLTDKFSIENSYIINNYDIIVDCTDNIDCRYLINDTCKKYKKKYICSSVLGWEGQIYCYKVNGGCYRCMYLNKKTITFNCDESGVISTMCGIIGSLTANEVIKSIENEDYESYIYFDGRNNEFLKSTIRPPNKNCIVCFPKKIKEIKSIVSSESIEVEFITWNEAIPLIENNKMIIIDVRSNSLFNYLKFEKSINIPLKKLQRITKEEVIKILNNKMKNIQIGVLCKLGISAQEGSNILNKMGFDTKVIKGGLKTYTEVDPNFEFF